MTSGGREAMAETKCAFISPDWPLSLSSHLLPHWHLGGKEKKKRHLWPGRWIFLFHESQAYLRGRGESVYYSSFGSHQLFLPSSSENSMLQRRTENKAARVSSFLSSLSMIQLVSSNTLLCSRSREGMLAQAALGVPCSYFPASWGEGRRGVVWGVDSCNDNDWSYQKLPYFQLIIEYSFFLSQIDVTGTVSQQQGEGTAPLTSWSANVSAFWPLLWKLGSKEWRSMWHGGRKFSG